MRFSLPEIYLEIIKGNDYSIDDCKCFAAKLSDYDKTKGINRILTYSGIFQTPCLKCLYNNVGFEIYNFAYDDILSDNVDIFVSTYNDNMEQLIQIEQLHKIKSRQDISDKVFVNYLYGYSKCKIQELSDTLINIRINNDTLEQLFKSDLINLNILITDSLHESIFGKYNYSEIKTNGAIVNIGKKDVKKIYVTFDFSEMPDNLEICWCSILEKRYNLIIPIKLN